MKFFCRKCSTLPLHLAYSLYGNSQTKLAPLIINHGLFGSKNNWNSLSKAFNSKTSRNVISIDARNHGDSPHSSQHSYNHLTADLKSTIDDLNLYQVALLGHSMGGRTVMLFALQFPKLVEKLIVVDISPVRTSPKLNTMPTLFQILQNVELPQNVNISKARSLLDLELSKEINDKGLRSFLLTNLKQQSDGSFSWKVNLHGLKSNFNEIAQFPLVSNLIYDGPVLFIAGANSDYIQKSDHRGISKLFPKAQFKYIEEAGHWVHSDKPTEFLQTATNFLNN